jgi:hypothetical protein
MSDTPPQASLTDETFEGGHPPVETSAAGGTDSPAPTEQPTDTAPTEPPERDFAWGDPTDVPGQPFRVVPNAEQFRLRSVLAHGGDRRIKPDTFGFVVSGVEQYLAANETREVELPSSYSAFEELAEADDLPVHWVSTSVSTMRGGLAIQPRDMEAAIRIATGGGRYSASDLTFHIVKDNPAVIEAPDGAFVVPAQSSPSMGSPSFEDPVHVAEAAGMEIRNEMDETMLAGIEAAAEALETHFGWTLAEHVGYSSSSHHFVPEGGYDGPSDRVRLSANTLRTLARMQGPEEVVGEHETRASGPAPDTFTLSEADRDEAVDPIGPSAKHSGTVAGYLFDYQRTGGRYSRTRRRCVRLKQVQVSIRDGEDKSAAEVSASDHRGAVVFEHQRKNENRPGRSR